MKKYRLTREYPYRETPVLPPLEARQGIYLHAHSADEALAEASKMYPEDVREGYGFTVTRWL
jgi:hypothetical protein